MPYQMQVKFDYRGKKTTEWITLGPPDNGAPYTFATRLEAEDCLRMCFPLGTMDENMQVIEVTDPVNMDWSKDKGIPQCG